MFKKALLSIILLYLCIWNGAQAYIGGGVWVADDVGYVPDCAGDPLQISPFYWQYCSYYNPDYLENYPPASPVVIFPLEDPNIVLTVGLWAGPYPWGYPYWPGPDAWIGPYYWGYPMGYYSYQYYHPYWHNPYGSNRFWQGVNSQNPYWKNRYWYNEHPLAQNHLAASHWMHSASGLHRLSPNHFRNIRSANDLHHPMQGLHMLAPNHVRSYQAANYFNHSSHGLHMLPPNQVSNFESENHFNHRNYSQFPHQRMLSNTEPMFHQSMSMPSAGFHESFAPNEAAFNHEAFAPHQMIFSHGGGFRRR